MSNHAKNASITLEDNTVANLSYSLVSETGKTIPAVYGIEVELKKECGQVISRKTTDAFTGDYSFAQQILEFAAKHKVGPYTIEDIIEDNYGQLLLAHNQQSAASAMQVSRS